MTDQGTRSRDQPACPAHFSAGLDLDRPPKERSESLANAIIESAHADPKLDCANCIEEVGLRCPLKDSVVTVELLGRIAEQAQAITVISRINRLLNSPKRHIRIPVDKLLGFVFNALGFSQHEDLIMDPALVNPQEDRYNDVKVDISELSFQGVAEVHRGLDPEVVRDIGY